MDKADNILVVELQKAVKIQGQVCIKEQCRGQVYVVPVDSSVKS